MDLTTGFTVIIFDIAQNRAIRTEPSMKSLAECQAQHAKLKAEDKLPMIMHKSMLSCMDMLELEQFEKVD